MRGGGGGVTDPPATLTGQMNFSKRYFKLAVRFSVYVLQ